MQYIQYLSKSTRSDFLPSIAPVYNNINLSLEHVHLDGELWWNASNIYRQDPSPEVDEAWANLYYSNANRVFVSEEDAIKMGWDLDILVKWPDDPTGRTYVAVSSTSPKENSKVSADCRLFPSPGDECVPSRTLRERLAPRSFPRLLLVSTLPMYIPVPSPARHLHISIYYFQQIR